MKQPLTGVQSVVFALALALPTASGAATYTDSKGADERVVVSVNAHDLDLSGRTGASIMLERLDNAAMEACGALDGSLREYRRLVQRSACHATRMDRAVAELNAPLVTELYARRAPSND
jgi:UrcA family protein